MHATQWIKLDFLNNNCGSNKKFIKLEKYNGAYLCMKTTLYILH